MKEIEESYDRKDTSDSRLRTDVNKNIILNKDQIMMIKLKKKKSWDSYHPLNNGSLKIIRKNKSSIKLVILNNQNITLLQDSLAKLGIKIEAIE